MRTLKATCCPAQLSRTGAGRGAARDPRHRSRRSSALGRDDRTRSPGCSPNSPRRSARPAGALRGAVRRRPRDLAASVRARARRLARPRPGDGGSERAVRAPRVSAIAVNELPDYLPAVLEYLSTRPAEEVHEMLEDCAHILRAVGERWPRHDSRYAAVFARAARHARRSAARLPPSRARRASRDARARRGMGGRAGDFRHRGCTAAQRAGRNWSASCTRIPEPGAATMDISRPI